MKFSENIAFHLKMAGLVPLATLTMLVAEGKIELIPKIDYSPQELTQWVRKYHVHLTPEEAQVYADKCHQGVERMVTDSSRDFDNDGQNDSYLACKDGTIVAKLSSGNSRVGRMPTDFWYDASVQ